MRCIKNSCWRYFIHLICKKFILSVSGEIAGSSQVAPLCLLMIYLPLIKKSARGHLLHVYAKGKVSLNILNILSTIMHACYF